MSKQTIEKKADEYLLQGKVKVEKADTLSGHFLVWGSSEYAVTFISGWHCTCPARLECAHIIACRKISLFKVSQKPTLGKPNEELDEFFNQFPKSAPQNDFEEEWAIEFYDN